MPVLLSGFAVQETKSGAKVVGGNVLRVWKDVDAVALKMQKAGVKPVEDKFEVGGGALNGAAM